MDIYDARKIQKDLYKKSECGFKRMITFSHEGDLRYIVIHRLSYTNVHVISKNTITRMLEDLHRGLEVHIECVGDNDGMIPEGMYLIELIKVD